MRKVILDTNVILSGVLFGGTPRLLLGGIQNRKFTLYISKQLLDEVFDKLVNKFHVDEGMIRDISILLGCGVIIVPKIRIHFPEDEKDAYLLELAEECRADYLVTGDKKHLIPLKKWKNTQIISPKKAQEILL
jgi:putative PIN family toxin of toxin-antitoxin system